jgi:hypothetical protein
MKGAQHFWMRGKNSARIFRHLEIQKKQLPDGFLCVLY